MFTENNDRLIVGNETGLTKKALALLKTYNSFLPTENAIDVLVPVDVFAPRDVLAPRGIFVSKGILAHCAQAVFIPASNSTEGIKVNSQTRSTVKKFGMTIDAVRQLNIHEHEHSNKDTQEGCPAV